MTNSFQLNYIEIYIKLPNEHMFYNFWIQVQQSEFPSHFLLSVLELPLQISTHTNSSWCWIDIDPIISRLHDHSILGMNRLSVHVFYPK